MILQRKKPKNVIKEVLKGTPGLFEQIKLGKAVSYGSLKKKDLENLFNDLSKQKTPTESYRFDIMDLSIGTPLTPDECYYGKKISKRKIKWQGEI